MAESGPAKKLRTGKLKKVSSGRRLFRESVPRMDGQKEQLAITIGYNGEHKAWKFCNPDQPASIQWSNSATFHKDKGWDDCQQEAYKLETAVEVEEEDTAVPTTMEEEAMSKAAVEDLLPAMDNVVGAANTAALNLDSTLREAMDGEDTQLWKEAIHKELEGLEAMAIRAILALAVQNGWEVHALDITMAYLNSTLKEASFMKPPEGSGVAPGQVYKVVKGLYGLKQSGQEWNLEFDKSLQRIGFYQVECTPCIYTKGHGKDLVIVVIYVNNTLVIALRLEAVLEVKKQIGQKWKMEDSGEVSHFLSITISRDHTECTMTIGQAGYIDQVLKKHLDKCTRPAAAPMQEILEGTVVASKAQQKEYPVIVGKLLWIANSTQPDLSLAVSVLARHM
ncbi:hypothetical protein NDA13_002514 [Ustilago tritici]|nr:hypothetical protein NDA13_002514 [Ustilago tritici]